MVGQDANESTSPDGDVQNQQSRAAVAAAIERSSSRGANVSVPASQAIEAEVDIIEIAIDHPPKKADHFGTAVTLLGAVYTIARTHAAPIDHGTTDALVIGVAGTLGVAQFTRYVMAAFEKTPVKDKAKQHIKRMRAVLGCTTPEAAATNWSRLKAGLWKKLLTWAER